MSRGGGVGCMGVCVFVYWRVCEGASVCEGGCVCLEFNPELIFHICYILYTII